MKKKLLALMPYAAVLAVVYYVLPLLMKNTGLAILIMLIVVPLLTLICGVIYGARQGFDLWLPLISGILFVPSIFIYYNATAWIYIVVYAGVALVGNGIGRVFYKKR